MSTEFATLWGFEMSSMLYLDYNCFQRGFDDQQQTRIRMQTIACADIFIAAARGDIKLAWSFMHEDENMASPFAERQIEVLKLAELCKVRIAPSEEIRLTALKLQVQHRLSSKDALHVACAVNAGASHFVTCDDAVKKRTRGRVGDMVIMYPTEYVMVE